MTVKHTWRTLMWEHGIFLYPVSIMTAIAVWLVPSGSTIWATLLFFNGLILVPLFITTCLYRKYPNRGELPEWKEAWKQEYGESL